MSKRLFLRGRPALFTPKFRKQEGNKASAYVNDNSCFHDKDYNLIDITNFASTSSYRYLNKEGLVSTQEINIDYDFFENHTFFHSAVAKTNEAFDSIINHYPFDGTLKEIESFEDGLTGFEKRVLDRFPKNTGYLNFSGSSDIDKANEGTYITVKDRSGNQISSLSKNNNSNIVLDPEFNSFSLQMYLNVAAEANDNQVIVQKVRNIAENFTLFLSESSSASECELHFGITSGSTYNAVATPIKKGSFSHITAMYDRENDKKLKLLIFDNNNKKTIVSSSNSTEFGLLNYHGSDLTIGTGRECRVNKKIFTPIQTLSGSIDDFKIYHRFFNEKEVEEKKNFTDYRDPSLKLYFKFNEPQGDYTGNNTVLDSSGNSLNSIITNFNTNARLTGSDCPVLGEDLNRSPVLFPTHSGVLNLNTELINSGTIYDEVNPNIITKLVPRHYFDEGNIQDNFSTAIGNVKDDFNKLTTVRSNVNATSSTQILTKFLLTWGKFFDEMKIFIDNFSLLNHVNYRDKNTVADKFLLQLGKKYGIELPPLFGSGNNEQLFYGENTTTPTTAIVRNLINLQNIIWRNILTNFPYINKKRGTLSSIRQVFRAAGIEPDNLFRIREYGGAKIRSLNSSTELKKDVIKFLNFSGSIDNQNASGDYRGVNSNAPRIASAFLSASRREIGKPLIKGTFVNKDIHGNVHGESNFPSDGLLTSGSFTYQGTYKFSNKFKHSNKQSLVRLHVTASSNTAASEAALMNVVSDKEQKKITLFTTDNTSRGGIATDPGPSLFLTGVDIQDGDPWAISFGVVEPERLNSNRSQSSLYFLRAGKFHAGKNISMFTTSSYITEDSRNILRFMDSSGNTNTSGSFIVIGSQSMHTASSGTPLKYLNHGTDDQKYTYFSGEVTNLNFWSKFNTLPEFERYGKDTYNVGSKNPLSNYNFNYLETGSYGRLRLQTISNQGTTASNSQGEIKLFDVTQNNFHFNGVGFEPNKILMSPHYCIREMLDYDFDLNTSSEKVRIRSFQDIQRAKYYKYASTTPVHEVRKSEEVFDDTRLSIDLSVMKGLNENIMRIFSDHSFFDNALGKPNILFSEQYRDLIALRRMYFNNLLEKLNLEKYRNLFKWIDNAFTELIFSLVPRTTNFLGINFIYESHVLERHRLRYLNHTMYCKGLPPHPQDNPLRDEPFEGDIGDASNTSPEDPPPIDEPVPTQERDPGDSEGEEGIPFTDPPPERAPRNPPSENDKCQGLFDQIYILNKSFENGDILFEEYTEKFNQLIDEYHKHCLELDFPPITRLEKKKPVQEYTEHKDNSDHSGEDKQENAEETIIEDDKKIEEHPPDAGEPDRRKHDHDRPPRQNEGDPNKGEGLTEEEIAEERKRQAQFQGDYKAFVSSIDGKVNENELSLEEFQRVGLGFSAYDAARAKAKTGTLTYADLFNTMGVWLDEIAAQMGSSPHNGN